METLLIDEVPVTITVQVVPVPDQAPDEDAPLPLQWTPEQASRALAAAILAQAVEDVKEAREGRFRRAWMASDGKELAQRNREQRVRELYEFFATPHFRMLCAMVDLDAGIVRERVGI